MFLSCSVLNSSLHRVMMGHHIFQTTHPIKNSTLYIKYKHHKKLLKILLYNFILKYFLFHHKPQNTPNIHLQILQKKYFKTTQSKRKFKLNTITPTYNPNTLKNQNK